MSTLFYGGNHQHHPPPPHHHHQSNLHSHQLSQMSSHNHHGRSRRAARSSASQTSGRPFRGRAARELNTEAPNVTAFRLRFEAGRSFDLDDDLEFCPYLLTDDERSSVTSGGSDRSSLSSGSPDGSPVQQQSQPHSQVTPPVSLSSHAPSFFSPNFSVMNNQVKLHEPAAVRSRNAIPIVNPTTGMRIASPPNSISPGMLQHAASNPRW